MKKTVLALSLVLALSSAAWAHMGPGMMGAPEQQNQQWGWGPGMMGGYGMMGMGQGMMNVYNPKMQKFLDETRDLRKELNMKQFDYMEALRNPKTAPGILQKLQKEILDLTVKLYEKMPLYPYGQ